jgi:hypothetical protein
VPNFNTPYTVYKYVAASDSYVSLPTSFDTNAKTVKITLTSIDDPVLATGGSSTENSMNTSIGLFIAVAIIAIVLLALFLMIRWPQTKV